VKKMRDFLINLRENVFISAVFRSFSSRFHRVNREVVFYGGAARSFPPLAPTEGKRQRIVIFQGERRNAAHPRP
jgi:hypothetical protein